MKTCLSVAVLFPLVLASALACAEDAETRRLSAMLVGKWVVDEQVCKRLNLDYGYNSEGLQLYSLEFKATGEKLFTCRVRGEAAARYRQNRDPAHTVQIGADGETYVTLRMRWEAIEAVGAKNPVLAYRSLGKTAQIRQAGFSNLGQLIEGKLVYSRSH